MGTLSVSIRIRSAYIERNRRSVWVVILSVDMYGGFDYAKLEQKLSTLLSQLQSLNSKISKTLLQFVDGTLITNPRLFKKIYEGYAFSVSHRFESVDNDESVYLYFENPSDSGREIFLVIAEVISFGQLHVDVYRNNTVTSSGSSIEPVNLNFESTNQSIANVEYGGTYTLGNLVNNTVCPGGYRVRAIGGATEIGESVVMPEDFNLTVKATNKSGADTDLSIRLIWFEEPI